MSVQLSVGANYGRGLVRQRLLLQLDECWRTGLATVVAPAGSGKTTLLHQWSSRSAAPVVWLTTQSGDASATALVQRLCAVITRTLHTDASCSTTEELLDLLASHDGPVAIIVDDVHNIHGAEAEAALATILAGLPENVAFVVSSRRAIDLRVSRRRVSEALLELGIEDLRFRAWETEHLFRREYGIALLPDEAARLTSRTQGWAAGLQLFHLAVRDKARSQRLRLLECFGGGVRAVGDYLADNVMADLPPEVSEFMVETAPLGVLDGDLCDRFLGTQGSAALLEDLERRELFLLRREEGEVYSYHEILRSYLDGLLTARIGETEARVRHYQAARLLLRCREEAGSRNPTQGADAMVDAAALRALCRAGAWQEAAALIATRGEQLVGSPAEIISGIPDGVIEGDPWLQLAKARRYLGAGNLHDAVATYERCERALPQSIADVARRERLASASWLSPFPSPAPGWIFALRRAVSADPVAECAGLDDDVEGLTCQAIAHLLSGHATAARELFERASVHVVDAIWDLGIRVGHTAACLLAAGDDEERRRVARRCLPLAAEADRLGVTWLNRQAHALLALVGETEIAGEARRRCQSDGDPWGEVLAGIFESAGRLLDGEAPTDLSADTSALARSLGAGSLEAIAMAEHAAALLASQYPDTADAALSAEAAARRAGLPGAQALCHKVLGGCRPQSEEHLRYATMLADECGLGILRVAPEPAAPTAPQHSESAESIDEDAVSGVQICSFGGLEVRRDGRRMDDTELRPRSRALLAVLALQHPQPLHVDVLIEALWPDAEYDAAAHRMQTAVSSLRRFLQQHGDAESPGSHPGALVRRASAYVLEHVRTDVDEFQALERRARSARLNDDRAAEMTALRGMLALYQGDLLPEFGSAEWLVRERDRLRLLAADAAERQAEVELEAGNVSTAMSIARRGLDFDCYRESLWRLAELTAESMDDHVAAARVRAQHAAVLSELDVCID